MFLLVFPLMAENLMLSKEEQNTIKNLGTIKVGVIDNMPPIEYYGVGYKHQGIISDFLLTVSKKLNLPLKYISSSHENLYNLVLRGKIDMLSYAVINNKNKNVLLYTSPFLEVDNAIFTLAENSIVNHIKDLANSLVGVKYDNYFIATTLKDKYPNMSLRFVNSREEAIEMLISGEMESFIGDTTTMDYLLQRLNASDKIKKINIPWLKTPIRFAVSKNKPKLFKLLQKTVESIDYKTYNAIIAKWIQNANKYKKLPLYLTKKENEWRQNHPTILIGINEWKPISFLQNGKIQGIAGEYLNIISKKIGINFKYKEFKSFKNLTKSMENKKIDIIDSITPSKNREKYMLFSEPYLSSDNIIATVKNKKISKIKDLKNKKVGVLKGYIVGSYIKNDIQNVNLVEFSSIQNGLKSLSSGKLDAFVLDLSTFDFYTAKYKLTNLIVSANTPYSLPMHFGIQKDEKILLSIFNKALRSIDEKKRKEIYRKWISVKFAQKIDYALIWKIVAIFGLFILGTLYWNRKLSLEVDRRKLAEHELVAAKDEAVSATKAKSIFLANMSHEIRTPMNSVIGFADLLDDLVTDPVQKGYLRSIKVGGKALLGIINDILDLSKIETGQLKIKKESVHAHNLFLEMEHLFRDKIVQKNLNFEVHIEPDIPKFLILDGVRVRQILLNLVGNAVKFTDKGTISIDVKRIFKDANKSKLDLIFSVSDTGVGIPKEEQDDIFGEFIQKQKQSVKKYGGTGLGLSICKKLVEAMDGKIELISDEGKGSMFKIHINDVGVSSLKEEDTQEYSGKIEFSKANILITDDIEENRELIKAIFSNTNLTIKEAKNGEESIKVVDNEKIDLIFMDLQMPIMDGYEATKKLRQNHSKEKLPIVALTASVMGDDLEKVPQFGFNDYLRKPASKNDIITKTALFIKHRKIDTEDKKDKNTILFNSSENKKIFIEKIGGDLYNEWKDVKDKGDIELIKNLNDKFIELLKLEDIALLKEYTQKISVSIEGFDLVEMFNLMSIYPNIVEKIKNSEVK